MVVVIVVVVLVVVVVAVVIDVAVGVVVVMVVVVVVGVVVVFVIEFLFSQTKRTKRWLQGLLLIRPCSLPGVSVTTLVQRSPLLGAESQKKYDTGLPSA